MNTPTDKNSAKVIPQEPAGWLVLPVSLADVDAMRAAGVAVFTGRPRDNRSPEVRAAEIREVLDAFADASRDSKGRS